MADTDRFSGPLAAAWPGAGAALAARTPYASLPVPPARDRGTWAESQVHAVTLEDHMLVDVWGERLYRLAIDVTAIGSTGTLVLTVEEPPPHEALLGGAP